MRTVAVVGCLGGVPATAAGALAGATLIAGAARLLSTVDNCTAERVVMGDVPAAVERIAAHDGPAVVLASGDPGFFGIVRALRRRGLDVDVSPAPSSVAVAFARIGEPWDDALVVSAHGRRLAPAVNACRAYPKVAILTGPGAGPAELGAALAGAAGPAGAPPGGVLDGGVASAGVTSGGVSSAGGPPGGVASAGVSSAGAASVDAPPGGLVSVGMASGGVASAGGLSGGVLAGGVSSGGVVSGGAPAGVRRRLVVAECLGEPGERITEIDPAEAAARRWREPNVVLVLAERRPEHRPWQHPVAGHASAAGPGAGSAAGSIAASAAGSGMAWIAGAPPMPGGWALPDEAFEHRMITRSEVRALALARLGPRLGDLLWDVGAGSGSVAVEGARFGAAVLAVERDPAACASIRVNCERWGVEVGIVEGEAPGCLADLPDPDAVFVGGGGIEALKACLARRPSRVVATYAALDRVGPAMAALAGAGYRTEGVQVQANRLAALPDGTHRLAAINPVHVVSGALS